MLFESLGQGYIFLLILCLGLFFSAMDSLLVVLFRWLVKYFNKENIDKRKLLKNQKKSINNSENLENKSFKSDNNAIMEVKRQITFLPSDNKKVENISKKINNKNIKLLKNSKKFTKKKKLSINIKNGFYCLYGFLSILVFGISLVGLIYWVDYGDFRFYHFLAFVVGFWLFKTIFAKVHLKNNSIC